MRRGRGLVLVAAALVVTLTSPASSAQPAGRRDPAAGAAESCPGTRVAAVIDGRALCTHGRDRFSIAELTARGPAESGPPPTIRCHGDGRSGARVQLLYGHYQGVNHLAELRPLMRDRAGTVEAIMDASAAQSGGHRHIRWVTGAGCVPVIQSVTLPRTVPVQFYLARHSYHSADRKYLIWIDIGQGVNAIACGGLGTYIDDAQPGSGNANNQSTGYAMVDSGCLGGTFNGHVEAHELMHTLGSVLWRAPHSTRAGHCRDDHDIMCYDDAGRPQISPFPCPEDADELRYDCHDDDYFSAHPAPSSWLAQHWNTAHSRFLTTRLGQAPVLGPPGAPRDLAVVNEGFPGVILTWTPPASDGGTHVTEYRVYRDGQLLDSTSRTGFTDDSGALGVPANYEVGAVNAIGEGPRSAPVVGTLRDLFLEAYKVAEDFEVPVGGTIHFLIAVSNSGGDPLTNVVVTDAEAPNCNRNIGMIAPGAEVDVECTDVPTSAQRQGAYQNVAIVTADHLLPVRSGPTTVWVP